MSRVLKRGQMASDVNEGLLSGEHFQIAYVTNDLDRACALFNKKMGIAAFRRLEGKLRDGGEVRVALAWAGGTMYELITACGPGSELYTDRLPHDGFAIRHHHLGYVIGEKAHWKDLWAELEQEGRRIPAWNMHEGFMSYFYVDVPELGHFLEFFLLDPAGIAFFETVPGS